MKSCWEGACYSELSMGSGVSSLGWDSPLHYLQLLALSGLFKHFGPQFPSLLHPSNGGNNVSVLTWLISA